MSEHTCFKIYIPDHKYEDIQVANLFLQIQLNGQMYASQNLDPILVYPYKNVIFIETDKPVYKPGSKVLFRVLILTQDMKPPEKYMVSSFEFVYP